MDFMNPANSYPVAYRLIELEKDYGPYQKGNLWAEPDINEAAAIMRRVIDHPDEARKKGEFARQDIEQFYGAEVVAQHLIRRLKKIEGWRQLKQTGYIG
jgi:glycosyltransferase involved in cell wall biosynthesis